MTIEAEGGISFSEELIRETLAACARFQTWCGVATAAAAKERIHYTDLPPPGPDADGNPRSLYSLDDLKLLRPLAIVSADGFRMVRVGSEAWEQAGSLLVTFEQNVPEDLARDPAAIERRWKNDMGVIVNELSALSYQAGYLAIDRMLVQGPYRSARELENDYGDFLWGDLQITWGRGI